jgi:hypothetical protein
MTNSAIFRIIVAGFLLLPALAWSDATITYQGHLKEGNAPAEGAVAMTFRLFGSAVGGVALAEEVVPGVEVNEGLFQVHLDFGEVFDGSESWLEVEVGGQTLTPRQRVSAVPVALYALSGPTGDSHWVINGSHTAYLPGNVGIGTDTPQYRLDVLGTGRFGDAVGIGTTPSPASGMLQVQANTSEPVAINAITSGSASTGRAVNAFASATDHFGLWVGGASGRSYFAHRVGIRTTQPQADLHVMGTAAVGSFASDHRLGVGTDNPWTTLHVVSNAAQDPLRVMIDNNDASSTAIRANGHGGVAIGNGWGDTAVPERGLRVHGEVVLSDLNWRGNVQAASVVCTTSFDGGSNWLLERCGLNTSSVRYKEDIQPLASASDLTDRMQAVSFRWKESGEEDLGLIAEEMAEIEPRLVFHNENGEVEGIKYNHLTAVLIRAMQERQRSVDAEFAALKATHESELAARDARIDSLQQALNEQQQVLNQRLATLEALMMADEAVTHAVSRARDGQARKWWAL